MRPSVLGTTLGSLALLLAAAPALAQEHAEAPPVSGGPWGLLTPHGGLMFWTLVIFVLLFLLLWKFAFPQILGAVEAREKALEDAIEGAKRDRDEAARLLAEQQRQLAEARTEGQKLLAEARAAGERMRAEMLEATKLQQQELLDRARRDIEAEKNRAIGDLRREAVDLAIAGAGRVIERNLDDATNRKLVEDFLAGVGTKVGR